MTAPEQAMTLEERELVVNVLRNYHRDHTGDPEFGVWPQIAHRLAGRLAAPATQRDDTAELVEAEAYNRWFEAAPSSRYGSLHAETFRDGFRAGYAARRDDTAELVGALLKAAAHLAAAVSLLREAEELRVQPSLAVASNRMFATMLDDYDRALQQARAALARYRGEP